MPVYNCLNCAYYTQICLNCEHCDACCLCDRVSLFKTKLKFHKPSNNQFKINPSSRFIAAEIEINSINDVSKNKKEIAKIIKKWNGSIVHDGSLDIGGFEINTAPAAGDLFVKQIASICDVLNSAGANIGINCGLHVHVDARDFNFHDIKKLLKIYTAIEPALFYMVPKHRRNSKYCRPLESHYANVLENKIPHKTLRKNIVYDVYGDNQSTVYRNSKYGPAHYDALNVHSWFFRGTIECRLFEGTTNAYDIINWGMMWANILDTALHLSDTEIDGFLNKKKPIDNLINIISHNNELIKFINIRYKMHKNEKIHKVRNKDNFGAMLINPFEQYMPIPVAVEEF